MKPADELEKLAALQPAVEPRVLVQVAQAPAQLGLVHPDIDPGDRRATRRRSGQPGQYPDRRRLARAVGTEQAEDRSLGNVQVEAVEGKDGAEVLRQPAYFDRRPSCGWRGCHHASSRPPTK